jgi:glyoxylase-like metal-dependent hydrolase (beta-lactamase superfamily II)
VKAPILAATLGFVAAFTAAAQRDFSQVEIKVVPVTPRIHMLEGAGGNIGVLTGDDGVLIVDTQFAPLAPKIEAALRRLSPGKLQFVLNTHWHGDHTGGNAFFGTNAQVVAHENVRTRLLGANPPAAASALPDLTFKDGALTLHFNGEEVRVIPLPPGHTDGDALVWFKTSNVIHLGDQFFRDRFPFVDLGSGGDVAGYIKNVETALALIPSDAKVIPGHGALATVDDLKNFLAMMKETTGLVRDAIAAGKSLDNVKAAGLPEKWKDWGTGFINTGRWLEITYNSFTAKR